MLYPEDGELFATERLEDYLALSLAAVILLIVMVFF